MSLRNHLMDCLPAVNMYDEDAIEVDVVWPGAFSDSNWIGYIRKDDILAAKNTVKPVEVDMGDLGKYVSSLRNG
jgi:hypothetical protein